MKRFALIGENISYSYSPAIHNYLYGHLGVDAKFDLLSISKEELPQKIEFLKSLDGFNVTQPHKTSIIAYLSEKFCPYDAVNTVVSENGSLSGYNTDEYGFRKHISQYMDFAGKNVLILGAGGMSEVAANVLVHEGAKVYILNRTFSKAEAIAQKVGAEAITDAEKLRIDAVVNCSSQGLFEKSYELPKWDYSKLELAYDTIYFETPFSRFFKNKNVETVSGLKMLIYQAIRSEEIFLSLKITDKIVLGDRIEKLLYKAKN